MKVFLLNIFLLGAVVFAPAQSAKDLFMAASNFFEEENVDECLIKLSECEKLLNGSNARIESLKVYCYIAKSDWLNAKISHRAFVDFTPASERKGEVYQAVFGLGEEIDKNLRSTNRDLVFKKTEENGKRAAEAEEKSIEAAISNLAHSLSEKNRTLLQNKFPNKESELEDIINSDFFSSTSKGGNVSKVIIGKERFVELSTKFGTMVLKLYDSTPLHRDNFIKLVKSGFYDSLLFHRVISGFMIQGGDPGSKYADSTMMLGGGSAPGERIPAEFKPQFFHKKGALAAARDGNPAKASSNCQFYIVQGNKIPEQQLTQTEQSVKANNPSFSYSAAQKEVYARIGGTPFLDQNYTVFGEVISGLDVIDKIAAVQKGQADRPKADVRMKMRMLN